MYLDYIISNPNKTVFIRLGKNGQPETCGKALAQRFNNAKAYNVVENLPKTMKKFHFKVECVPEEIIHSNECKEKNVIVKGGYKLSDSISQWQNKIKSVKELADEALKRKEELINEQSNVDKQLSNILHKIELESNKGVCDGYKEYKKIKDLTVKRREIKDEMYVVSAIISSNMENISANRIGKVIAGLSNRVFEIREIKEYE